jgi:aminoglycoside phosphotransferase (APT) family kinase protein
VNQHSDAPSEGKRRIEMVASDIFSSAPLRVESAMGGISTTVYRIVYPNETFYLRLLPDANDSFASEVAVHTRLRRLQVKVPEVIHFEHFNEILQRSVMVTTAIQGRPVSQSRDLGEEALLAIAIEAGRDLAQINMIPVDGFGRLRGREKTERLLAKNSSCRAFMLADWDSSINYLADNVLATSEVNTIEQILLRYDQWLDAEQAFLAHGDFSTRHIFQNDGQYLGVIDFGDSQGTDGWYDLGYFHMRDGGLLPYQLGSALLSGYGEITSLPSAYEQRIRFTSVLITVKMLAYALRRGSHDRSTLQQLKTLRRDLVALLCTA